MKNVVAIASVVLGLCTVSANALNITVDAAGNLMHTTGIADSTQYGMGNNNPGSNLSFLNNMIGNWNANNNPDLPSAIGPVALNIDEIEDDDYVGSYAAASGYDYVVFHFGAGKAGGHGRSEGGFWQALYLGGSGGNFSVPVDQLGRSVGGFSSARYFNKHGVPDAGSTLALFGLALTGFAFVSRKRA